MSRTSTKYAARLPLSDRAAARSPEARRGSPACPQCKSGVNQVPRRLIDRLLGPVYPVRRYHCRSFICGWEGNLPYEARYADGWEVALAPSPTPAPARSAAPEASTARTTMVNAPIARASKGNVRRAPRRRDPVV